MRHIGLITMGKSQSEINIVRQDEGIALVPPKDKGDVIAILSPKKAKLVTLVCEGKSNKEIAFEMGLAEGTVKEYLFIIFKILGISNRTELAMWEVRRLKFIEESIKC